MNRVIAQITMIVLCSLALPGGAQTKDYSKAELQRAGLPGPHLVPFSGFATDWTETLYYRGDTASLNQFLELYKKLPGATLNVLLHPGTIRARSPQGTDRGPTDWTLWTWSRPPKMGPGGIGGSTPVPPYLYIWTTDPNITVSTQIDIWFGGKIDIHRIRIPAGIAVRASNSVGPVPKQDSVKVKRSEREIHTQDAIDRLIAERETRESSPDNSKPRE